MFDPKTREQYTWETSMKLERMKFGDLSLNFPPQVAIEFYIERMRDFKTRPGWIGKYS